MMKKLEILSRQASVDTHVTLRLTRGQDVTGQIAELDGTHVCLDLGREKLVTIFEDILAGWEIHSGGDVETKQPIEPPSRRADKSSADDESRTMTIGNGNPHEEPAEAEPEYRGSASTPAPEPGTHAPTREPKVIPALERIEATFSEAMKRARLEPPEPDFEFSTDAFPSWNIKVRHDWDRARNRYDYAVKVKELGRLNSIITQLLEPLAGRYPDSAAARSLLGRMLLKLDRRAEARDHLSAAAILSGAVEHWLALAFTAGSDTALECYALRRCFNLTPPSPEMDAWYRYLTVAIAHHDLHGVAQTIQHWSEQQGTDTDLKRLLTESLAYLLSASGAKSFALEIAANSIQAVGELPSGWKSELERTSHPSEELLAVENEFDRISIRSPGAAKPHRSDESDDVPHGHITSFGNQRFGFVDAGETGTFFFHINDVRDDRLHSALLDGTWRTLGEVEFGIVSSYGHKFNRATNIIQLRDRESLLQRARDALKVGHHSQAIGLVRRILGANPHDEEARQLETRSKEDFQKQLRESGDGLPKGRGPYARAKRAQLVDHNLTRAEDLLRQAIRNGDNTESAVKDLASLLQQQARGEDAILLLKEKAKPYRGSSPYDNMLATVYQHAGRHDEAVSILARLKDEAQPSQKAPLLKRIAYSYFKSARYDDAEQVLREVLEISPGDRNAAQWLERLEDARAAEAIPDADEFIGELAELTEEGVKLSSLAHAALRRCTFEGVDPAKLQAGTTSAKDIAHVEKLARNLGARRPRDRAAYYLSAAALLGLDSRNNGSERIYDHLRKYFASMADAFWIEKKPADVVRSYYIESMALVSDGNLYEAWYSLLGYIATFSQISAKDVVAALPSQRQRTKEKYICALQAALETVMSGANHLDLLEGLVVLGSQSSFARDSLGEAFRRSSRLKMIVGGMSGGASQPIHGIKPFWQSQCRERALANWRQLSVCRTLIKHRATVASMENLDAQLRNSIEGANSEIDRKRLSILGDIVKAALDFCRTSDDFEEKEQYYWLVTTQTDHFIEEVIDAPTQYSHEGLLPVAEHIRSLIEEEYAELARISSADLSLRLLVEEYQRGQEGELRLQVEISNKRGCSPASSVRIRLSPTDSRYFSADIREREVISALRGGNTEVGQMVIRPKPAALEDRAFSITARAIYRDRLGEEKRTEDYPWTVRLYPDEEFQPIDNPYAPFAEGGPVDNAEMFVGRTELLTRVESSLLSGSGSKSIVMFGQKRAGKSSLIEHLKRRLGRTRRALPVSFSLQDIASELTVPAFLHRILQGISEALEDLRFDDRDVPDFSPPGIDMLESHPALQFHDSMSSLARALRRHSSGLRLVLLIDEFTDIFKEIRRAHVPRSFMKAWKAIIEKKYFASVLVGQDIMPAFKAEFPNEFGVTEDVRVTYLDDAAAETLIQKPIGEERFAGNAVGKILDLTAGSPYYTMMFCSRLVDYMNVTRSVIVTAADILTVEQEMLRGDRRLTRDKFDNLLCAGDGEVDSGVNPDETYEVCAAIAMGSEGEAWCSRELIKGFGSAELDMLLSDLETRDVVERKGTAYRLRVGLFRDWLAQRD